VIECDATRCSRLLRVATYSSAIFMVVVFVFSMCDHGTLVHCLLNAARQYLRYYVIGEIEINDSIRSLCIISSYIGLACPRTLVSTNMQLCLIHKTDPITSSNTERLSVGGTKCSLYQSVRIKRGQQDGGIYFLHLMKHFVPRPTSITGQHPRIDYNHLSSLCSISQNL